MDTQLELDLPALAALATSRDACAAIVDGRRPGVTRLVARGGEIVAEDVGFGYRRRLLEFDPIPGLRMSVPEALREQERQQADDASDGWDE
jgi:hypothetical protein